MNSDVKVVAEIGINHNGDLDIAKQLIDRAAVVGCDFVKFQKRTVNKVYTFEELEKDRESPWGTTNRQQKEGLEFHKGHYDEIDNYCFSKGIGWFASPWDVASVDFLMQYNLPFIKIPSALVTDYELLEKIQQVDVPVILSTGMCVWEEVAKAVDILAPHIEYILACTSTYPTFDHEMNLSFLKTLAEDFPEHRIGFSNHNPGIFYAAVAAAFGAQMIEFHVTLDRAMYGSDQSASIELAGMTALLKYIRRLPEAMGTGDWVVTESEQKIKDKLRK